MFFPTSSLSQAAVWLMLTASSVVTAAPLQEGAELLTLFIQSTEEMLNNKPLYLRERVLGYWPSLEADGSISPLQVYRKTSRDTTLFLYDPASLEVYSDVAVLALLEEDAYTFTDLTVADSQFDEEYITNKFNLLPFESNTGQTSQYAVLFDQLEEKRSKGEWLAFPASVRLEHNAVEIKFDGKDPEILITQDFYPVRIVAVVTPVE